MTSDNNAPTYRIRGSIRIPSDPFEEIQGLSDYNSLQVTFRIAAFDCEVSPATFNNRLAVAEVTFYGDTSGETFSGSFDLDFSTDALASHSQGNGPPSVFFRLFPTDKQGAVACTRKGDAVAFPSAVDYPETRDYTLTQYVYDNGEEGQAGTVAVTLQTTGGELEQIGAVVSGEKSASVFINPDIAANLAGETKDVQLRRPETEPTTDQALWVAIRQRTKALEFSKYEQFINRVFCTTEGSGNVESELRRKQTELAHGLVTTGNVEAYNLLRVATDAFLLLYGCGGLSIDAEAYEKVILEEQSRLQRSATADEMQQQLRRYLASYLGGDKLPYIQQVVKTNFPRTLIDLENGSLTERNSPFCYGITSPNPCMIELIWSYWHESGMLVQAMNAVSLRFQNKRMKTDDPLANLGLDPLRPLNNLIWGYVQNEFQRLSLSRRVYEYAHQYGLALEGKAVPRVQAADSRVHFLEAFHTLLVRAMEFYLQDNDTTVISDGFALLNALKEVHILLAQGAQNQYGDLPWTARSEMLSMQYLLSRAEMREFLRGRLMVPYQEAWMGQVDVMNKLQGWTDLPINHFRDLGVYGEQLLIAIRFDNWVQTIDQDRAKNFARYWRSEIKSYVHAYQALTGVDLSASAGSQSPADLRATQPATLIRRRTAQLQSGNRRTRRIPGSVQSEADIALPRRTKRWRR